MNQTLRLTLALLVGVTASLQAQESNRWGLFQSLDWGSRQSYLEQTPSTPWDEDFLRKALELTDSSQIETGTDTEVSIKTSIAIRLVRLLAALPAPQAAPSIARLPLQYRDPVLRGEAWTALAQLGDRSVIPGLVRILSALNESGARSRSEEIQAAYAIQALGVLKAPEAFRAVAAASLAWYSPASGVRALARKSLTLLVPDVEKSTLELLANDEDLAFKEGLFEAVADQGDVEATARAAAAVLGPLVHFQAEDKEGQDRTTRLMLATLIASQKASAPPATLVPPLRVLLIRGESFQAKVQAIRLLGKIDDPSALALLTSTLSAFNEKQKYGTNKAADLALVRELFQALAATGKSAARTALDEARYSDYSAAMVKEATAALAQLPQ